ncbi:hypothetical protein ACF0H5_022116 [Mactra antiquata]
MSRVFDVQTLTGKSFVSFQVGSWFVVFFVISSVCMLLNKLTKSLKFSNLPICSFILNITSKILQLTFPYILWRYVYLPTRLGVNFGINYMFGACEAWYCTWGSVLMAIIVTGAVVSYTCQSPAMKEDVKTKKKSTQRVTPIAKRTRSAGTDKRRPRSASRR